MGVLDNADAYVAGKTSYKVVGQLQRHSMALISAAKPRPVCWQVWAAVMTMTATYSKLLDRTSLNSVADAAGIARKGSRQQSGTREEAVAAAKALAELGRIGAITYRPPATRPGRPVAGTYVSIVVGLPDPAVIVVCETTISDPEWWSARPGNGGLRDRGMVVAQTTPTEKRTEKGTEGGLNGRRSPLAAMLASNDDEPGAFTA